MRRVILLLLTFLIVCVTASCTVLGFNRVSLDVTGKPVATPHIDVASFRNQREDIKEVFERTLYGEVPRIKQVEIVSSRSLSYERIDGLGTLEEIELVVSFQSIARKIQVVLAVPLSSQANIPVIVSQTFSSNCSAFPGADVTPPAGRDTCNPTILGNLMMGVAENIVGEFIAEVPLEQYLEAGIAYASFYGPSLIPDSKSSAPALLDALSEDDDQTGTIAAWATGYAAVARALSNDRRFNADATIAMGHSRYGKAALVAGAWFDDINGVIAHQSGFGGAALSRSTTGEGLKRMVKSYPHWLSKNLTQYTEDLATLPVDQHHLIALNAPKPLLIGNGRQDVWSDPNSTFRAVLAADAVYTAAGAKGLGSPNMRDINLEADLVYYLRAGRHAIIQQDITTFIDFVRAHFVGS